MKATKISASNAAATASAKRCSEPSVRCSNPASLHRVDLVEHAGRPALGLVRGEVHLLRVLAEGGDVGHVHLQPMLAEDLGQLGLALLVLGRAPGDRLVG